MTPTSEVWGLSFPFLASDQGFASFWITVIKLIDKRLCSICVEKEQSITESAFWNLVTPWL